MRTSRARRAKTSSVKGDAPRTVSRKNLAKLPSDSESGDDGDDEDEAIGDSLARAIAKGAVRKQGRLCVFVCCRALCDPCLARG